MYIYPDNHEIESEHVAVGVKRPCSDRNHRTGIRVCICLCKTVVPDGDSRRIRIFNDTGGGYHHLKIYPLCMCVFFGGTAAL